MASRAAHERDRVEGEQGDQRGAAGADHRRVAQEPFF